MLTDMPHDDHDLVDLLKSELAFVEQGGYGRSVRTPWKATSMFQDSPTCLNFNDPARPHPCSECHLLRFVPTDRRREDIPCHHIPLNPEGQSVDSFERWGTQGEMEEAVATWLRTALAKLENERAQKTS